MFDTFISPSLAFLQEAYWKEAAKQVKKDRKDERIKLIDAFNFLGVLDLIQKVNAVLVN